MKGGWLKMSCSLVVKVYKSCRFRIKLGQFLHIGGGGVEGRMH